MVFCRECGTRIVDSDADVCSGCALPVEKKRADEVRRDVEARRRNKPEGRAYWNWETGRREPLPENAYVWNGQMRWKCACGYDHYDEKVYAAHRRNCARGRRNGDG